MKKILKWIINNMETFSLLCIFPTSIFAFITNEIPSPITFFIIGGALSVLSFSTIYFYVPKNQPLSKYFNTVAGSVLILGVISLFLIHDKKLDENLSNIELFLTTYFGALIGMIFSGFLFSLIKEK